MDGFFSVAKYQVHKHHLVHMCKKSQIKMSNSQNQLHLQSTMPYIILKFSKSRLMSILEETKKGLRIVPIFFSQYYI